MNELLIVSLWFLAGALSAAVHARLLLKGVQVAVERQSAASLLLGAPLRVALPAGLLFASSFGGLPPLCGGLVGFVLGGLAARWRLSQVHAPAEVTS